jgi:hypothetical protein
MSHFAAIGLYGVTPEEFERCVGEALERAGSPPGLGATDRHAWFQDASGAALAAHMAGGGQVDCITPFFVAPGGGTRWRVRTSAPHLDRGCVHCSGADCDLLDGAAQTITRATVQWVLFQPYQLWLGEVREYDLEVVGFASSLSLCETADDLERAQAALFGERDATAPLEPGKPLRLAEQAFLPYGMFEHDGDIGARARALVTGTVETMARPTNRLTGLPFVHVRLQTLGGSLDVVAPQGALAGAAAAPRMALADVWLVGRPCEPPPPAESRGWLRKLNRA